MSINKDGWRTPPMYSFKEVARLSGVSIGTVRNWLFGYTVEDHRPIEFLKFLRAINREVTGDVDIHMILDNYGTHGHPKVKAWLAKHPRFKLHFTPTSSSWLNLVERWFGEITRKRIRRGVFKSVSELIAAIEEYIRCNNENPKPFVWTKRAEDIIKKVNHCKAVIETLH